MLKRTQTPLDFSAVDRLITDPEKISYDLELFLALNEVYRERPLYKRPPALDDEGRALRAQRRLADLDKRLPLTGKRVLEIGCGRGHLLSTLATTYDCEAHGVDVYEPGTWAELKGRFHKTDLTDPSTVFPERDFDVIYSFSVWEHVVHPRAMLARAFELLKPGGSLYLSANLYRGQMASHRYREVYFPWPHLLFSDEVFRQFYESIPRRPQRAAWVNRLSAADYLVYFDEIGFETVDVTYAEREIDEEFYRRFHDLLSRYPRRDLGRNFIQANLRKPG